MIVHDTKIHLICLGWQGRFYVKGTDMDKKYGFWGWKTADVRPVAEQYAPIVNNPRDMYDVLMQIWCSDTCAPRMRDRWTKDNPTLGQCSITAFLAQDVFGGRVYGIPLEDGGFHLYNVVGDCAFDLTSEQFGEKKLDYSDNPEQFRETHFEKEEKRLRYEYLKSRFEELAGTHTVNVNNHGTDAPDQVGPTCYAARTRDKDVLGTSSSGGIFTELALNTLKAGGVVYGVAMSKNCRDAEYVRVTDEEELGRLRGSKYIEARADQTFRQVEQDLRDGRRVLFSGTPCKLMGLGSYLKTDYPLLLKVAIVCHGTADGRIWTKYVDMWEKKCGSGLASVSFRSKKHGWTRYGMKLSFTNGKACFATAAVDEFHRLYRCNAALKKACYECPAKKQGCVGDIQIGDLWGAGRIAPDFNDDLGASCVICHTAAGLKAITDISCRLELQPVRYEELIKCNPMIKESVSKPVFYEAFQRDMETMEIGKLARKYAPVPLRSRLSALFRK